MSITSQVEELINSTTSLDRQIEIIQQLNQKIYHAEALYDIAKVFLAHAKLIHNPFNNAIDIVGTGGDGKNTLNYSTLTAFIISACGYPVIKHGNKSATSKCGSFDFLEKVGEKIPKTVSEAEQQLKSTKKVFLFAPYFHPIFKNVVQARQYFAKLGEKTIFNILGPMLNPARPKRMLVGVYKKSLIQPYSEALSALGVEYGCVVYGNGFDEFSICGTSDYCKIEGGKLSHHQFNPEKFGYTISQESNLYAGNSQQNYKEAIKIFSGNFHGPKKDMLELNASHALAIADGFSKPFENYIKLSKETINYNMVNYFNEFH